VKIVLLIVAFAMLSFAAASTDPGITLTPELLAECRAALVKDVVTVETRSEDSLRVIDSIDKATYVALNKNGGLSVLASLFTFGASWEQFEQERTRYIEKHHLKHDSTVSFNRSVSIVPESGRQNWLRCIELIVHRTENPIGLYMYVVRVEAGRPPIYTVKVGWNVAPIRQPGGQSVAQSVKVEDSFITGGQELHTREAELPLPRKLWSPFEREFYIVPNRSNSTSQVRLSLSLNNQESKVLTLSPPDNPKPAVFSIMASSTTEATRFGGTKNIMRDGSCGQAIVQNDGYVCGASDARAQGGSRVAYNLTALAPGKYMLEIEYSSLTTFENATVHANRSPHVVTFRSTGGISMNARNTIRIPITFAANEPERVVMIDHGAGLPNLRALTLRPIREQAE
jgi:hypothetical protein